jgi:UDP-4-amino-4,6-dideoxy-N-acetyl-beta-L-altrosamine transaminase
MKFIGYGHQSIDRDDIDAVSAALCGDYLTQGPAVERFEAALAERCGARYAIAVSSGTAALHIACLASGIGRGDFGLTAAITFAASANCFLYAGAEVGFVDIDLDRLGMTAPALGRAIAVRPETKVVIPVHMAGLACDMEEIRALTGQRAVIEDAAHALGGAYPSGRPVGCCDHAEMATFSFHPVKSITTGEGGAVLTNNADLARRLRLLRSHGIERDPALWIGADTQEDGQPKPWLAEQQILGFNYRMTDVQAALGLSQLIKLDRFIARRRAIASRYDEAFSGLNGIRVTQSDPRDRARSALHLYIMLVDFEALGTTRTAFMCHMRKAGIGTQVHYMPVYQHPFYVSRYDIDAQDFPAAEGYAARCLSLPIYPAMTDEEVDRVIAAARGAVKR